jgi:hypothetical protein
MAQNYAESKITEVLKAVRGNAGQAQKMIIEQSLRDHDLLVALVKPHMTGITAHAVNRVISGKKTPEAVTPAKPSIVKDGKSKDSFGMDILKTIAGGDTATFGQESYGRPVAKKGASQRHIDAINQIIESGKSKKS